MAMVFRDGLEEPWKMVVRSREYFDTLRDNSVDPRHGFMAKALTTDDPQLIREDFIRIVDSLFKKLFVDGGRLYRLADHKNMEEFFKTWGEQPWTSMRPATKEEVQRMGLGKKET